MADRCQRVTPSIALAKFFMVAWASVGRKYQDLPSVDVA